jgi:cytochrome c-type protein NapB
VPDAAWSQAVASRAERRAFDGAPPVIPHPVDQRGVPTCLACHSFGKTIRGAVAVPPSHDPLASCTQCHVTAVGPAPGDAPPGPVLADNAFSGLQAPARGERAWPIAPATIPHATFMREQCDSCHGPSGREPIRTSHPWRQSCQQCHAPSAARDQAPVL